MLGESCSRRGGGAGKNEVARGGVIKGFESILFLLVGFDGSFFFGATAEAGVETDAAAPVKFRMEERAIRIRHGCCRVSQSDQ